VPIRCQPVPGAGKGLGEVTFVQGDDRGDVLLFGGNQGTGQLAAGKLRLGGNQDQHLIQVGRKHLGAHIVLAIEQVASRLDFLNRAFVLRGQP
jgi:hypothetical protein